jgi:hypothetical protein
VAHQIDPLAAARAWEFWFHHHLIFTHLNGICFEMDQYGPMGYGSM